MRKIREQENQIQEPVSFLKLAQKVKPPLMERKNLARSSHSKVPNSVSMKLLIKPENDIIREASENEVDDIINFINNYFLPNEPINKSIQLSMDGYR